MKLKSVKIGPLTTPNNIFLAPLAGYTNAVFRKTCSRLGAGLTFTEMVSAKGLYYKSEKTRELLSTEGCGGIKACQIFGADPEIMGRVCRGEELAPFDLIDINMGCPMPKIYNNGEGSRLLNDPALAGRIISAVKGSGKAVSVKFRTGLKEGDDCAAEFAKVCEQAGADMITVHGRTRDRIYSGEVDFKAIARAKAAVNIPVIANGGVFTAADADKLMQNTGADGVMVARGALYNPFIFSELAGRHVPDKKAVVSEQLNDTFALFDARFATVYMRKMLSFYVKGQPDASALRQTLMRANGKEEILGILENINF